MSDATAPIKRKLIEVALPLEAINRESAREKSIRHGHPSTLHLWWARRPLAACRAVLFAQLVDDPSSHPDRFPTEEDQAKERRRLFDIIERLVVWENTNDEALLRQAHDEIAVCFDGKPPAILDPFAGGGSIPLEAQRLGLEAHASDLNPVAVLINKALIEIPSKWSNQPPVFPGAAEQRTHWPRATGLAEDVRRYGQWMRDEAERRIGHLYPKAKLPDGSEANVIAWIWARTVQCPNPACGAEMPLASTWWLSKKKDRPTWLQPIVDGKQVYFEIRVDKSGPPDPPKRGRGAKFTCLVCQDTTSDAYIKSEAMAGRMGSRLLCVVAEGNRQRVYLPATDEHVKAAQIARPDDVPEEPLANDPRNIWCVNYGLTTLGDLFTNRQLVALATFSDLVSEARDLVVADSTRAGISAAQAENYASGVALYLSFGVSRQADYLSTICTWMPDPKNEGVAHAFTKQAIPMTWDYAEANPFSDSSGNWLFMLRGICRVLDRLSPQADGVAFQSNAEVAARPRQVVATDPPYYDNIGYADLSDFFYTWLRRSLGSIYPDLTSTLLTPKSEELVALPHRHEGSKLKAEKHFERGFIRTFTHVRVNQAEGVPITLFYAYKQAENDDSGVRSTGWETMLNGLLAAGLAITATWPIHTERTGRSTGIGTNALASSIVLACRPRPESAEATSRRSFIAALKAELPVALRELQQASIAPVDLEYAAIGPGMAVFSRYRKVVQSDGTAVTVRVALDDINQIVDELLWEQEGDFDADTRFCVSWFRQFGWDEAISDNADKISRRTHTSVGGLQRGGVFRARTGRARLVEPRELSDNWNPDTDERISLWEVVLRLANALNEKGIDEAARLMARAGKRIDLDVAKELAYLLFTICKNRNWTQSALLFNGLGTSWSDLSAAARTGGTLTPPPAQGEFDFGASDEE